MFPALYSTPVIYRLNRSRGLAARMLQSYDLLCLWPLAMKFELWQRSQQGLCQRRKLVFQQHVWLHILTECRMNAQQV